MGLVLDCVVNINVPSKELISRLTGRRVCKECSTIYHIKYNPPKIEGVCNSCGGTLIQRDDDKEETVKTD